MGIHAIDKGVYLYSPIVTVLVNFQLPFARENCMFLNDNLKFNSKWSLTTC